MQKEFYESLGFALRKARKRQGFKQKEIANEEIMDNETLLTY